MRKTATMLILLAAAAVLLVQSPCHAGTPGKFASALKDKFCGGTSGPSWIGCYAYMYYRVDYKKDNNGAKSYCYSYGCGKKYKNVGELANCKKGCDHAYDADTQ